MTKASKIVLAVILVSIAGGYIGSRFRGNASTDDSSGSGRQSGRAERDARPRTGQAIGCQARTGGRGMGVTPAPGTAAALTDLIVNGRTAPTLQPFRADRFRGVQTPTAGPGPLDPPHLFRRRIQAADSTHR